MPTKRHRLLPPPITGASKPAEPTLQGLPNELLLNIASHVFDDPSFSLPEEERLAGTRDLMNMSLVCKKLNPMANKLLYKAPSIPSRRRLMYRNGVARSNIIIFADAVLSYPEFVIKTVGLGLRLEDRSLPRRRMKPGCLKRYKKIAKKARTFVYKAHKPYPKYRKWVAALCSGLDRFSEPAYVGLIFMCLKNNQHLDLIEHRWDSRVMVFGNDPGWRISPRLEPQIYFLPLYRTNQPFSTYSQHIIDNEPHSLEITSDIDCWDYLKFFQFKMDEGTKPGVQSLTLHVKPADFLRHSSFWPKFTLFISNFPDLKALTFCHLKDYSPDIAHVEMGYDCWSFQNLVEFLGKQDCASCLQTLEFPTCWYDTSREARTFGSSLSRQPQLDWEIGRSVYIPLLQWMTVPSFALLGPRIEPCECDFCQKLIATGLCRISDAPGNLDRVLGALVHPRKELIAQGHGEFHPQSHMAVPPYIRHLVISNADSRILWFLESLYLKQTRELEPFESFSKIELGFMDGGEHVRRIQNAPTWLIFVTMKKRAGIDVSAIRNCEIEE